MEEWEYFCYKEDELDELFAESIILPTQYEINEYRIIEDFIEIIENEEINYCKREIMLNFKSL